MSDDRSPSVCDRCYQVWLSGSDDFAPDCVSGCRQAYQAWRDGETVSTEDSAEALRLHIQERGKQVRALAAEITRESAADSRLDELARAYYEFDDLFQPPSWPAWTDADAVKEEVRERYRSKARDLLKLEAIIQAGGTIP